MDALREVAIGVIAAVASLLATRLLTEVHLDLAIWISIGVGLLAALVIHLTRNRSVPPSGGNQGAGIFLGPGSTNVHTDSNTITGFNRGIEDHGDGNSHHGNTIN